MKTKQTKENDTHLYTKGEEIFNMVSHIVGGALAIVSITLCVIMAAIHGNVWGVVSGAVYGASMLILYTMSSLYHGLTHKTAKKVFRIIDHILRICLVGCDLTVPDLHGQFSELSGRQPLWESYLML